MIRVARTPDQLARILKDYRALCDLSQAAVAARAGLKQGTLSVLEASATHAKLATIYKWVAALGLELVIQKRGANFRRRPTRRAFIDSADS